MPETCTALPAHRSPAASLTHLAPRACLFSLPGEGTGPGYNFIEKTAYRTPTTHNRLIRRDYALHPLCRPESARDHL